MLGEWKILVSRRLTAFEGCRLKASSSAIICGINFEKKIFAGRNGHNCDNKSGHNADYVWSARGHRNLASDAIQEKSNLLDVKCANWYAGLRRIFHSRYQEEPGVEMVKIACEGINSCELGPSHVNFQFKYFIRKSFEIKSLSSTRERDLKRLYKF